MTYASACPILIYTIGTTTTLTEYTGVKCTGTATVLNPTLNSCSPPMARYCKAYYMFTSVSYIASPVTSPVSSPVTNTIRSLVSSPVSTPSYNSYTNPTSSPVASPVTYPSSSSALSTTNSPVASPSNSTTFLTGFFQEIVYTDTACATFYNATSIYLNTCIHVGSAKYNKWTATSTYVTKRRYTDSACTDGGTFLKGFPYTSGACVSSMKHLVKQDNSIAINVARVTSR